MTTITFLNSPSEPTSPKQIEQLCKKIGSLETKQIETLAKRIIARMMGQFDLDLNYKMLKETSNKNTHPIYHIVPVTFRADSEILKTLLPYFSHEISKANPPNFIVEGLNLVLFNEIHTGLLDQIASNQIRARLNQVRKIIPFKESLGFHISVNLAKSDDQPLYFKIAAKIDHEPISPDIEGTLDNFEFDLEHEII